MTTQRTFWTTRPTLRERLLSWLLWHANTDPPCRERFYARIKDHILLRYGRAAEPRFEWQEIVHECWSCEGTGGLYERGGCYKCGGSGVYSRRFIPLYRWRIADRVFHRPGDAVNALVEGVPVAIKGRIHHKPSRHAWKAAFVLGLLFDRDYAWEILRVRRPFVWLRSLSYRLSARCIVCDRRLILSRDSDLYYCSSACAQAAFDDLPF